MEPVESFTIEALDESDAKRGDALCLLLAAAGTPAQSADRKVRRLASHVERHSLQLASVLGAFASGRLISAAMLIESPGRLGAAYIPSGRLDAVGRQATIALLHSLQSQAWQRSLWLVQALLGPHQTHSATILADAGFELLAELCYLERSAHDPCPSRRGPEGLEFVPYAPRVEPLFLEVLGLSYRESLDCPRLAGLRPTADVLTTHRATGIFDPTNWWVAQLDGTPVGILLLAGVYGRSAFEVVYMGVVPEARGRGVGDALLAKAVDVCRRKGSAALTLAVDGANKPARSLYRRWSMRELDRRRAWVCRRPRHVADSR